MKQETIDFIIETIKKYWEHYSKEDHGWCLTMPIIHKQALSDAIGELNKLKLKEPPEPEGESEQVAIVCQECSKREHCDKSLAACTFENNKPA